MEEFIIKCVKCGKEEKLSDTINFTKNIDIGIYMPPYDDCIVINCSCGNEVQEKSY